jgi:hypothetical protein
MATAGELFVRILSTDSGQEVARFRNPSEVERIQFSHDGKYMATTDFEGTRIWLWKPDDTAEAGCARLRRRLQPAQWPPIAGESFAARLERACPVVQP